MSEIDCAELIISIVALAGTIVNVIFYIILTKKYNDMVNTQTLTAQGALETQVRASIHEATRNMLDFALRVNNEPENEMVQKAYFAAEEIYRNAYEDACAKYLDYKIDRDRFRKMYQREIQTLVENVDLKEFYDTVSSPYASTVAVYREWFGQA
ncbi:MAG: hypothetical protein MR355_03125 [Lachnospiraceae bacterium]|nr:hypothetical protein [Lachnospiraceae bacterium]